MLNKQVYDGGDEKAQKGLDENKGKLKGIYLNIDQDASIDEIFDFLKRLLTEKGSFVQANRFTFQGMLS